MSKAMWQAFAADVAAVVVGLLIFDYARAYLVKAGYHPSSSQGS